MAQDTPDTSGVSSSSGGHLAFYTRHGISPVRYSMDDLGQHFERRDALYRTLGLPPIAFKGTHVLEVAPGSGQNSLYVATRHPARYELVEPNPAGLRDIEAAYAGLELPHTAPAIHRVRFEDFRAEAPFDIVLCENWLGSSPDERALIAKLARLVAPGGVLVLTAVPLAGFFPNVMRKLLALRLMEPGVDFEATTDRLLAAFSPHLETIAGMTRSHRDWVKDCMINPHYLRVALQLDTLADAAGPSMEVLSSCPRFAPEWRWFKAMSGPARDYNRPFLAAAAANIPNFCDQREVYASVPENLADRLASLFETGYRQALDWEAAHTAEDRGSRDAAGAALADTLAMLGEALGDLDGRYRIAFAELRDVWGAAVVTPEAVAGMTEFGALFGRETVYVSLSRRGD